MRRAPRPVLWATAGRRFSTSAKFCSECGRLAGVHPEPETPVEASPPRTRTRPKPREKILTSRAALEGERKQVTVLFADLKGSMELFADRDPEEARNCSTPSSSG